jgi:hypothetical protein
MQCWPAIKARYFGELTMPDQFPEFREQIARLFPRHVESVLSIALNEMGAPLGYRHVEYLDSWASPGLEPSIARDLRTAYVLLATVVFAIDRLWDEQSTSDSDILYPGFLTLSAAKILSAIESRSGVQGLVDSFLDSFDDFSLAMKTERSARNSQSLDRRADRGHLVNRSRLFIGLFGAICRLKGRQALDAEIRMLEEFLFWMQRGDDLGDWREDYKAGQNSYFIRLSIQAIGKRPTSEAEMEKYVYLSGAYEDEATEIINGLQNIETAVRTGSAGTTANPAFAAFVEKQRQSIDQVLSDFRSIKQRYIDH